MTIASMLRTPHRKTAIAGAIAMGLALGCVNTSYAGAREQAYRIYTRLAGAPPTNAMLDAMTTCINDGATLSAACNNSLSSNLSQTAINKFNGLTSQVGDKGQIAATYLAMQDQNFLNVKVKNMVIPWTNKDQTVFFPFNDAAATLVGLIRDGEDFRQALYADVYYDDPSVPSAYQVKPFVFTPAQYADTTKQSSNNNHYEYIEHNNLSLKDVLVKTTQTGLTGMPADGVAGVMTTRAMQRAFFYAGTNRAMLRFTFMNFLCNDFVQIKDVTSNPERVRQDPSRSPGGDSSVYLNNCIGCHAGMDGLAGAFAYYNWGPYQVDANADPDTQASTYANTSSPNPVFTLSGKDFPSSPVMPKYLQNFLSFPYGYQTKDDSWVNYWRVGLDANLGWVNNNPPQVLAYNPPNSDPYPSEPGNPNMGSAAQLGYELANTTAFARCQVLRVYRHVCLNDPTETKLVTMVNDFTGNGYNMQSAFSDAAIDCSNNVK